MPPRDQPTIAKYPTHALPQGDIQAIFDALRILAKVRRRELTFEPRRPTPSRAVPGGTSVIVKHHNRLGPHIATTHTLYDRHGRQTSHWHGKDILLGGIRFTAESE